MEIELTDDKAGNIVRVARGIDNLTGEVVMTDTASWTYSAAKRFPPSPGRRTWESTESY
jgi:hypothetical protein